MYSPSPHAESLSRSATRFVDVELKQVEEEIISALERPGIQPRTELFPVDETEEVLGSMAVFRRTSRSLPRYVFRIDCDREVRVGPLNPCLPSVNDDLPSSFGLPT